MTDTLDTSEEAQILELVVRKQLEIEQLQEEVATLKAYFKERGDQYPVGSKNIGKFYLKVTTNRRVDDTLARTQLSATVYNRLTKKVIDSTLAKKSLTDEQYNKIVKTYENRIEIGLR